ncbi:hypothetical protein AB0D94_33265 [Streptomyces sp. NPDC048255]|uniref:hypothetical protein n=1 Tax=Streptomyces sp. NPDC048255 TaxID=3154713 RepID=UPI003405A042
MASGGGTRWNPQTQRWEAGEPPPADRPPPAPPAGYAPWSPGQPPPGGYPPPAGPWGSTGRERHWKVPLLVALGAAMVGAGAVAGWFLLAEDDPMAPAAPPPATGTPSGGLPGTDPPSEPPPSASPSPSPGETETSPAPGSYTVVHSEDGFSVAVPTGWQRSHDETGDGSFYRPPGSRRSLLQVFRVKEGPGVDACELLRESSAHLRNGTSGYEEVSREPVSGASCELVYEYDSEEAGGRRRGVERIAVTPDGDRWALLAAGPADEWATTREHLDAALREFRPDS